MIAVKVAILAILSSLNLFALGVKALAQENPKPINYALYFDSELHDSVECGMNIKDDKILIDKRVVNPSMSCPDMFSWKLYVEVILQSWWSNWASDQQTWPSNPLRLCDKPAKDCCAVNASDNPGYDNLDAPAVNCPYFPGDHVSAQANEMPRPRPLTKPIGAHAVFLGRGGLGAALEAAPAELEPGRVIRQEMGEITLRNKEMFNYIFSNDLYNQQGIVKVFERNKFNLTHNVPYQAKSLAGSLSKIDLPISAIMIKSNWIYNEFAKQLGLKDDPQAPYIKKHMTTILNEGTSEERKYTGEHWLISFHISTKDIPQWVWATFEHVNNPGRCDFTGCNDSYGYASPDRIPADTVNNFTAPHIRNDGLRRSSWIFDLGKPYSSGDISKGLNDVFRAVGIGTTAQKIQEPRPTDSGWRSYRLKGSQVNFTNAMGRSTRLGNSVTEGGFMVTSSCITCHARASVTASGNPENPISQPLGVFQYDDLSELGYPQSAKGIPDKDWFHGNGSNPTLNALQTDFLWGMPFLANPLSGAK